MQGKVLISTQDHQGVPASTCGDAILAAGSLVQSGGDGTIGTTLPRLSSSMVKVPASLQRQLIGYRSWVRSSILPWTAAARPDADGREEIRWHAPSYPRPSRCTLPKPPSSDIRDKCLHQAQMLVSLISHQM
jgi:hypothetical protein